MIIGIMGMVGSGKSECVNYIKNNYKCKIYFCDKIAKKMIKHGEIDYKVENADDFFKNKKEIIKCRKILHKAVFDKIFYQISNSKSKLNIIETALPSKYFIKNCDKTIYVYNSLKFKNYLLSTNRKYSINKIKSILYSQKFYIKFYKMADYKIKNDKNIKNFHKNIKEVLNDICFIC